MNYSEYLLLLALFSVIGGLVSAVKITVFLKNNGVRASMFLWNFKIFTYVNQYKEITFKKNGKTGWLFYSLIIFFNLAFFSIIIGWIIR